MSAQTGGPRSMGTYAAALNMSGWGQARRRNPPSASAGQPSEASVAVLNTIACRQSSNKVLVSIASKRRACPRANGARGRVLGRRKCWRRPGAALMRCASPPIRVTPPHAGRDRAVFQSRCQQVVGEHMSVAGNTFDLVKRHEVAHMIVPRHDRLRRR